MEHQRPLHATPFGMVFLSRILEKPSQTADRTPWPILAGELLDLACILQAPDGDEMEHALPSPVSDC